MGTRPHGPRVPSRRQGATNPFNIQSYWRL